MNYNLLIGLTAILFFGILAQWLSWKLRAPSILLLLIFGFIAGPGINLLKPDEQFGQLLFPIVSLCVAVILFEGGMNLKISELKIVGRVVRNLISIGIIITWILASAAAYFVAGIDYKLAILFGAILVVTGPTVILPILNQVRPTLQVNSVLKWEGIINDPIGALLALLVFEVIIASGFTAATTQVISSLLKTILISTSIGLIGGYLIVLLIKNELIPESLQNSFSLAMVVTIFSISNLIQPESGLFAVTGMGIFLANQKIVIVRQIIEFKENLRVLLLSVLFILLAARLEINDILNLKVGSFLFVAALIFIIRPAAVFASSINSPLNLKEKIYISWMAPRGVVAAAVTSLFAIELSNAGYSEANYLISLMFLVIILTIAVYGLSASPLAKKLGIASPNPQGCLILGANPFGREIGKTLKALGYKILLVDTNYSNINEAKSDGLETYYGSILSENIMNDIDLSGIGKLLAITPNHEVNSLADLYYSKIFGNRNVFQLSFVKGNEKEEANVSKELRGNVLFGSGFTYADLTEKLNNQFKITVTKLTAKFRFENLLKENEGKEVIKLFRINERGELIVYSDREQSIPKPGETLIHLVMKTL